MHVSDFSLVLCYFLSFTVWRNSFPKLICVGLYTFLKKYYFLEQWQRGTTSGCKTSCKNVWSKRFRAGRSEQTPLAMLLGKVCFVLLCFSLNCNLVLTYYNYSTFNIFLNISMNCKFKYCLLCCLLLSILGKV